MQWGWQQASLTCGSQSCAWAGLVSAGWTALQCFLDRMWCSTGGKTHRPFQEYRQYCSQHSRKLGQSFYLRCLSCFWVFGIWKLRKTVRKTGREQVRTQTLGVLRPSRSSPYWALSFSAFVLCFCAYAVCVCVSSGDKVVIISNPASLISEVYWERPRTTNVPQIHVEARWKFRILIKGAEDERKIVLVISGAMHSGLVGGG